MAPFLHFDYGALTLFIEFTAKKCLHSRDLSMHLVMIDVYSETPLKYPLV